MKVLKDNYNEKVFICTCCLSELLVNKDDLLIDEQGDPYFTCPLCGERNYVEFFGL
jgi:DNA-directed RNA polymerase subunit RPC12/RpoP